MRPAIPRLPAYPRCRARMYFIDGARVLGAATPHSQASFTLVLFRSCTPSKGRQRVAYARPGRTPRLPGDAQARRHQGLAGASQPQCCSTRAVERDPPISSGRGGYKGEGSRTATSPSRRISRGRRPAPHEHLDIDIMSASESHFR